MVLPARTEGVCQGAGPLDPNAVVLRLRSAGEVHNRGTGTQRESSQPPLLPNRTPRRAQARPARRRSEGIKENIARQVQRVQRGVLAQRGGEQRRALVSDVVPLRRAQAQTQHSTQIIMREQKNTKFPKPNRENAGWKNGNRKGKVKKGNVVLSDFVRVIRFLDSSRL